MIVVVVVFVVRVAADAVVVVVVVAVAVGVALSSPGRRRWMDVVHGGQDGDGVGDKEEEGNQKKERKNEGR